MGAPIVGLVLAAGAGRRYGGPKILVPEFLEAAVAALRGAGVAEIGIVTGAARPPMPAGARELHCKGWESGMGASLRCGLESLPPETGRVVVHVVDCPDIGPSVTERVLGHDPKTPARAVFNGRPGHPVVIPAALVPEILAALDASAGANDFLRTNGVALVECSDLASGQDIDFPPASLTPSRQAIMKEILSEIADWPEPFAVATVVETWSSSPRSPGAAMAVDARGRVVGSVSGGCVEGDLYTRCEEVLETGHPQLAAYGLADDDAFTIGLTCGGTVRVFVRRVDPQSEGIQALCDRTSQGLPTAVATVVEGGHVGSELVIGERLISGTTGSGPLDEAITHGAQGLLEQGRSTILRLGADGQRRREDLAVFVESYRPPPRMIVFGATDFAAATATVGKFLGYRVTLCDARPVFATPARFPQADEVVIRWPHEYLAETEVDSRTAICVLTHDPKFDLPLLERALRTSAGFIGVMGSRRTHEERTSQLRARGVGDHELARLSSPVGLDLGARTPEETAVSIAAELIARRWGGTGLPLGALDTPIHHDSSPTPKPKAPLGRILASFDGVLAAPMS